MFIGHHSSGCSSKPDYHLHIIVHAATMCIVEIRSSIYFLAREIYISWVAYLQKKVQFVNSNSSSARNSKAPKNTSRLNCSWNCSSALTEAQSTSLSVTRTPNTCKSIKNPLYEVQVPPCGTSRDENRVQDVVMCPTCRCLRCKKNHIISKVNVSFFHFFDKRSYPDYNKEMKLI